MGSISSSYCYFLVWQQYLFGPFDTSSIIAAGILHRGNGSALSYWDKKSSGEIWVPTRLYQAPSQVVLRDLTGFLLLIVGIAVLVAFSEYDDLLTKRFFNVTGFVIATGVIILLGSVLGFYSAISQQFYFVAGYVVLLLVTLIFEIAIIIAAFALSNDATEEIRLPMLQTLQQYGNRVEINQLWDDLQRGFQCCGVQGRGDWISNQIPVSCCFIDYGTISPFECGNTNAHTSGCAALLGEWLSYNAYVIAVCAVVATCVQVLLSLMGGYLAYRSKFEVVELES